jgi:carbon monoxide dehydrogenase subunit G
MHLDSTFKLPVPLDEAWRATLDYPAIVRCVPGATLADKAGDDATGRLQLKLGPAVITYQGKVTVTGRDEATHRLQLVAAGREAGGNGTASAQFTAVLTGAGGMTEVALSSDVHLAGTSAQFGRGVLADVGERIAGQFAENLARELEGGRDAGSGSAPQRPTAVSAPSPSPVPASPPAPGAAVQPAAGTRSLTARRAAPVLAAAAAVSGIAVARRLLRGRA